MGRTGRNLAASALLAASSLAGLAPASAQRYNEALSWGNSLSFTTGRIPGDVFPTGPGQGSGQIVPAWPARSTIEPSF